MFSNLSLLAIPLCLLSVAHAVLTRSATERRVACPRLCVGMIGHSNVTGPCPPQAVGMPPKSNRLRVLPKIVFDTYNFQQ